MNRIYSLMLIAALGLAGCQSRSDLPPGENGTRAGGNGAFGSNVAQPGEGVHGDMNGTGSNVPR